MSLERQLAGDQTVWFSILLSYAAPKILVILAAKLLILRTLVSDVSESIGFGFVGFN
jgi:hypothetical protein